MRHQIVCFSLTQTFFHCALNTDETGTELVLSEFAYATHTAITQVIDIIDFAAAIAQLNQNLDYGEHVFVRQRHGACQFIATNAAIELHTAHSRQIVTIFVVKQSVEQSLHGIFGRWFARAHHAIDSNACCHLICCVISAQGLRNVRTLIQIIGIQRLNFRYFRITQMAKQFFGQFVICICNHFTGFSVNDIGSKYTTQQIVFRHRNLLDARCFNITHMLGVDTFVFCNDHFACFVADVKARNFSAQTLGNKFHLSAFGVQREIVEDKEIRKYLLSRHADCFEQNRHWHLTAAVDTEIQYVFRVELKVQP